MHDPAKIDKPLIRVIDDDDAMRNSWAFLIEGEGWDVKTYADAITFLSSNDYIRPAVMVALVTAYGPDAFGPDKSFVAAQASVVATMVSGIPSVPWFAGGFIAGIVMYWLGIPAMMIGLGVYLPFYMSLTAFLGSCVKLAYDKWAAHRDAEAGLSDEEKAAKDAAFQEQGLVVASGLLGGESIVGVILAFVSVGLSLLG